MKEQLNIRVPWNIRLSFQRFCETSGLTQEEGILLLMTGLESNERIIAMNEVQKKINMQQKKINALEQTLEEIRHERAEERQEATRMRREWTHAMSDMVEHLIDRGENEVPDYPAIKITTFKAAKERNLFKEFPYPTEAGSALVEMQYLFYGKGTTPPIFICGETVDGKRIKVRWYPKAEYIGISPKSRAFAYEGSKWLMGYVPTRRGATDLVAAIPLASIKKDIEDEVNKQSSALDDLIAAIENGERNYFEF